MPVVVLVDSNTASASEIVTAALQDHHRATVVGTHTFGKGVFQEEEPLSNGGALDITVGEYFTPNGRNLGGGGVKQGAGVTPEVPVRKGVVDTPHGPGRGARNARRQGQSVAVSARRPPGRRDAGGPGAGRRSSAEAPRRPVTQTIVAVLAKRWSILDRRAAVRLRPRRRRRGGRARLTSIGTPARISLGSRLGGRAGAAARAGDIVLVQSTLRPGRAGQARIERVIGRPESPAT